MKKLFFILTVHILFSADLSATVFKEFKDLEEESKGSGIRQSLVICDDAKFESQLTQNLKELRKLPKVEASIIDPSALFYKGDFSAACLHMGTNICALDQGQSSVAFISRMNPQLILRKITYKEKAVFSYVATIGLQECIGITYHSSKRNLSGLLHLSLETHRLRLLEHVIAIIKEQLPEAKDFSDVDVTLTSSFYTPYLSEVYGKLRDLKFSIIAADIPDVYLTCKNGTCSGTKYISNSTLGISGEAVQKIKDVAHFCQLFNGHPEIAEAPRAIIFNVHSGQHHRLIGKIGYQANNFAISYVTGNLEGIPIPLDAPSKVALTKVLLQKLQSKQIEEKASQEKALKQLSDSK